MRTFCLSLLLLAIGVGPFGQLLNGANLVETWNSKIEENHNWKYWDTDSSGGGGGVGVPAHWIENGGPDGSAHISTPLNNLHFTQGGRYPFYIDSTDPLVGPDQELSITPTTQFSLWLNFDPGVSGGGWGNTPLYFFVGEYLDDDHDGTPESEVFYYRKFGMMPSKDSWSMFTFLGGGQADWELYYQGSSSAKPVQDLLSNPQQYGFVVPTSDGLSGRLHLDSLSIVPEPASASSLFLLACFFASMVRRRRSGA